MFDSSHFHSLLTFSLVCKMLALSLAQMILSYRYHFGRGISWWHYFILKGYSDVTLRKNEFLEKSQFNSKVITSKQIRSKVQIVNHSQINKFKLSFCLHSLCRDVLLLNTQLFRLYSFWELKLMCF